MRIRYAAGRAATLALLILAGSAQADSTPHANATERSLPAAGCYGSAPHVALDPLEIEALSAARARFSGPPEHAPELSLAAREIAALLAAGGRELPGRRALRLVLAKACAADPAASVLAVSSARAQIIAQLIHEFRPAAFTHLGVGVVVRGRFAHAVIIGSRRAAELEPFPREVAAGGEARLRGRLVGLDQPWVVITTPDGLTRKVPIESEAESFGTSVVFETRGRYVVEVGGGGPRGPEVAALLVVAVGGAALDEASRPLPSPEPTDPAEAEARVLAAVNAARLLHALGPLESNEPLRVLAREYSAEMLRKRIVAHVLPGGMALGERLQEAGILPRRALENLAVGESALAAHESLEESPAHLANLLDPSLTQLGVGIARGLSWNGEPAVYLTEILLTPEAIEPREEAAKAPEAQVREALRRERARLGRRPLRADPRLDEMAAQLAAEMLRSDKPGKVDLAAITFAPPGGDRYAIREPKVPARMFADTFNTSAPGRAAESPHLGNPRFGRVGVGVVIAGKTQRGNRRYWIAVIYAEG